MAERRRPFPAFCYSILKCDLDGRDSRRIDDETAESAAQSYLNVVAIVDESDGVGFDVGPALPKSEGCRLRTFVLW